MKDRIFMIRIYGLDTATADEVQFCKTFTTEEFDHEMYRVLDSTMQKYLSYNSFVGKYYLTQMGKILAM